MALCEGNRGRLLADQVVLELAWGAMTRMAGSPTPMVIAPAAGEQAGLVTAQICVQRG
jgi:hypothetical protein